MRTVLIALAVLCLCGCSTPVNNASASTVSNAVLPVAWGKVPSYFKCDFESHAIGVAPNGQTTIVPKLHNYEARTLDPLIYTQIDTKHGTARVGPNATIGPSVSMVVSDDSWVFIDTSDPSNVGMTTIFVGGPEERAIGRYRAVDSRHSIHAGAITAIQQYGHCEAVFT